MLIDDIKAIKSTRKELREFGWVVGIVLVLLGGLFLWRGKDIFVYFLSVGFALIAAGVFVPVVLRPVQKIWMALAVTMGWFMTRVILSLLFYFIFTPIRFFSLLTGKRFLDLRINRSQESYWHHREVEKIDRSRYEYQF